MTVANPQQAADPIIASVAMTPKRLGKPEQSSFQVEVRRPG